MAKLWHLPDRLISTTHSLGRVMRRDLVGLTPFQIRHVLDGLARLYPGPWDISFEFMEVNGIRTARISQRGIQAKTGVLLVHGGGFSFGSARTHRALASHLSRKAGCEVWIPEYRLAPEHPFPSGFSDIEKIYPAFYQEFSNRFVAGDSAGGNLAAVLVQSLRDTGDKIPEGLLLLSPWLDLRPDSPSNQRDAAQWSPFDRMDMLEYATHYLHGADPNISKTSPVLGDCAGLPPTYLEWSEQEYLEADALHHRNRLEAAGVSVTTRIEPAALHGWQLFPDILPEAVRSLNAMAQFIQSVPKA